MENGVTARKSPYSTDICEVSHDPLALDGQVTDLHGELRKQTAFHKRLIVHVRDHRQLYDPTHKQFADAEVRQKTWDKIAGLLKTDADECKNTWATLRIEYQRYARRLRHFQNTLNRERKRRPIMAFELELMFLWQFVTDKRDSAPLPYKSAPSAAVPSIVIEDEDDDILLIEDKPIEVIDLDAEDRVSYDVYKVTPDIRRLVENIKIYGELYNVQHRYFADYKRKGIIWNAIANELGDKATKLMKCWYHLIARYEWELVNNQGSTDLLEICHFLNPCIRTNPDTVFKQSHYLKISWHDPIDVFKNIYNLLSTLKKRPAVISYTETLIAKPKTELYTSLWLEVGKVRGISPGRCEVTWLILRSFYQELVRMRQQGYQLQDKWYFESFINDLYGVAGVSKSGDAAPLTIPSSTTTAAELVDTLVASQPAGKWPMSVTKSRVLVKPVVTSSGSMPLDSSPQQPTATSNVVYSLSGTTITKIVRSSATPTTTNVITTNMIPIVTPPVAHVAPSQPKQSGPPMQMRVQTHTHAPTPQLPMRLPTLQSPAPSAVGTAVAMPVAVNTSTPTSLNTLQPHGGRLSTALLRLLAGTNTSTNTGITSPQLPVGATSALTNTTNPQQSLASTTPKASIQPTATSTPLQALNVQPQLNLTNMRMRHNLNQLSVGPSSPLPKTLPEPRLSVTITPKNTMPNDSFSNTIDRVAGGDAPLPIGIPTARSGFNQRDGGALPVPINGQRSANEAVTSTTPSAPALAMPTMPSAPSLTTAPALSVPAPHTAGHGPAMGGPPPQAVAHPQVASALPTMNSTASLLNSNEIMIQLVATAAGNKLLVQGPPLTESYALAMEDTANFIRAIMTLPLLHNKAESRSTRVLNYWQFLATKFNMPVHICKACWNFLLENFTHFPQIAPMDELMKPMKTLDIDIWTETTELFDQFDKLAKEKGWYEFRDDLPALVEAVGNYPCVYMQLKTGSFSNGPAQMKIFNAWQKIRSKFPNITANLIDVYMAIKDVFCRYMTDLECSIDNKWHLRWWPVFGKLKYLVTQRYTNTMPFFYIVSNKMEEEVERCSEAEMLELSSRAEMQELAARSEVQEISSGVDMLELASKADRLQVSSNADVIETSAEANILQLAADAEMLELTANAELLGFAARTTEQPPERRVSPPPMTLKNEVAVTEPVAQPLELLLNTPAPPLSPPSSTTSTTANVDLVKREQEGPTSHSPTKGSASKEPATEPPAERQPQPTSSSPEPIATRASKRRRSDRNTPSVERPKEEAAGEDTLPDLDEWMNGKSEINAYNVFLAVRRNPQVYQSSNPREKINAWKQVALELNTTVTVCQESFQDAFKMFRYWKSRDPDGECQITRRFFKPLEDIYRAVQRNNGSKLSIKTPNELNEAAAGDDSGMPTEYVYPQRYIHEINVDTCNNILVAANWAHAIANFDKETQKKLSAKIEAVFDKYKKEEANASAMPSTSKRECT